VDFRKAPEVLNEPLQEQQYNLRGSSWNPSRCLIIGIKTVMEHVVDLMGFEQDAEHSHVRVLDDNGYLLFYVSRKPPNDMPEVPFPSKQLGRFTCFRIFSFSVVFLFIVSRFLRQSLLALLNDSL